MNRNKKRNLSKVLGVSIIAGGFVLGAAAQACSTDIDSPDTTFSVRQSIYNSLREIQDYSPENKAEISQNTLNLVSALENVISDGKIENVSFLDYSVDGEEDYEYSQPESEKSYVIIFGSTSSNNDRFNGFSTLLINDQNENVIWNNKNEGALSIRGIKYVNDELVFPNTAKNYTSAETDEFGLIRNDYATNNIRALSKMSEITSEPTWGTMERKIWDSTEDYLIRELSTGITLNNIKFTNSLDGLPFKNKSVFSSHFAKSYGGSAEGWYFSIHGNGIEITFTLKGQEPITLKSSADANSQIYFFPKVSTGESNVVETFLEINFEIDRKTIAKSIIASLNDDFHQWEWGNVSFAAAAVQKEITEINDRIVILNVQINSENLKANIINNNQVQVIVPKNNIIVETYEPVHTVQYTNSEENMIFTLNYEVKQDYFSPEPKRLWDVTLIGQLFEKENS